MRMLGTGDLKKDPQELFTQEGFLVLQNTGKLP
jgi:hypothetical protein